MKRQNKKGFTIIELVIVIAVIAILASVLIPVFSNIVDKANVSKDTQLVRNLNTALKTDSEDHETMYDALQAAEEYGYNVAKINASATDNEILWDSKNDCFVYLNGGKIEYIPNTKTHNNVADHEYWVISSTPSTKYSTYYTGSASEVAVTTGFDAGEKKVDVIYTGDLALAIIRTNGGNLTIDNEDANVEHYGDAKLVKILNAADNSYHLFGSVEKMEIVKGRVVVEDGAEVSSVVVDEANVANVKLDVAGEVGALYAPDTFVATGDEAPVSQQIITSADAGWTVVSTKDELVAALAEGASKIALGADIVIEQAYANGVNIFNITSDVELNMNTYTISAKLVCTSSSNAVSNALFTVKTGKTLTLTGAGRIEYQQLNNNFGWNAYSSVISNQLGTVIVDGAVVVEHLGGTDMAYAIDVLTNTGADNATLVINNGTIISKYRAIRAFCNSTKATVNITINGGTVKSTANYAIWIQNPSAKVNHCALTINGGVIESYTASKPIYVSLCNCPEFDYQVSITGGKFIGNGQSVTDPIKAN